MIPNTTLRPGNDDFLSLARLQPLFSLDYYLLKDPAAENFVVIIIICGFLRENVSVLGGNGSKFLPHAVVGASAGLRAKIKKSGLAKLALACRHGGSQSSNTAARYTKLVPFGVAM